MKSVVVCLLICSAVAFASSILDDSIISEVNSAGGWHAGRNARFEGVSMEDAVKLLGTRLRESRLPKKVGFVDLKAIPTSFDARTQWPHCIHPIRDQAQCGSCWAFGATESLSDRICIASGGKTNVILSPQDLVSCDTGNFGCQGGYLDVAWQFMKTNGVPTDDCFPYASQAGTAPACTTKCKNGQAMTKYHAKTVFDLSNNVAAIQQEVMTNGPVEVAFDVYQDFFAYKSGVYTHKSGGLAGGHAVKLVGWGVDAGTPYWIIANSWGTSWGQNGFFWIKRGTDECGIESNVVAGLAAVSTDASPIVAHQPVSQDAAVLDGDMIDRVNNNPRATWRASHNKRFAGVTVRDAKKLMGTKVHELPQVSPVVLHAASIPSSFDARTQWPNCIHPIRNQEQCGSCWAFAGTEALSDRFCIATNGATNVVLSPEDLVSCDTTDDGCQGGQLQNAWNFMAKKGVVSDACFPYSAGDGDAPACQKSCSNGGSWTPYFVQEGSVTTVSDVASIQTAIMQTGPVEASFTVYQDFMSYSSGVYQHTSGSELGGHAVKIVGWGESNGTPYWMIANSWGTGWGLDGYFMILRGQDECGIEDNVVFGTPNTSSL